MRWYFNELSLQGQFATPQDFKQELIHILALINKHPNLSQNFHVTRLVTDSLVCNQLTFRQAIKQINDANLTRLVLSWLDRNGPFVDQDRLVEDDDYFEYQKNDVTDLGLGEAARRIKASMVVTSFSFTGGALDFAKSPLSVDHGIEGNRLGSYDVTNIWNHSALEESVLAHQPRILSWLNMIEFAKATFSNLVIADLLKNALSSEPFNTVIMESALHQMNILNEYMSNRDASGKENDIAHQIKSDFFAGERALFSPESDTNQDKFKSAMTFSDPEDNSKSIFAHWHGKISHRTFRLHFEWPVPSEVKKLKVLYLGQKITKN